MLPILFEHLSIKMTSSKRPFNGAKNISIAKIPAWKPCPLFNVKINHHYVTLHLVKMMHT